MTQSATRKARTQQHKRHVSTSDAEGTKRKPPGSEKEFLDILIRNVVNATAFEHRASEEFNAAMNQFPGGLPFPEGAEEIKLTSAHLSSARKMLEIARNRLDNFINERRVPEDLRRSG
jgi:hypothetical protein